MDDTTQSPPAPGENSPPSSIPTPAAPPAAAIVLTGSRTEREVELEAELGKERETRKQREMRLAQLEDENHRLKGIPVTAPAPAKPKSTAWTLLEADDDED